MKRLSLTLAVIAGCTRILLAQQASSSSTKPAVKIDTANHAADTAKKKKATFRTGLNYNSNSVFLARTDSVATPNYSLGVTYTLKSKIFFSAAVAYIPNRQFQKVDGGSLETGYNFDVDNLSGGVALAKYFSSFNSTQIISALNATASAELSYNLFDVVTPSAHIDYALVKTGGNDFILTGGLQHEFSFKNILTKKDALSFEPAAHLNAGSQNFYSTYFVLKSKSQQKRDSAKSNGKSNGKGKSATQTVISQAPAVQSTVTTNTNKFQILAYEFNTPFTYTYKKLGVEFNPVYALAVHKIDDDGTRTFYVNNSSVFYVQVAVSMTF